MLLMTPEYAALREEKARETIDWLVGNFDLKPMTPARVARLRLGKRRRRRADKKAA